MKNAILTDIKLILFLNIFLFVFFIACSKDPIGPQKILTVRNISNLDAVRSVAITSDNKYIISGELNGLRIINFETGATISYQETNKMATSVDVTSSNDILVAWHSGRIDMRKSVGIWQIPSLEFQFAVGDTFGTGTKEALISPDDKYILAPGDNNTLKLWQISDGIIYRNFSGADDQIFYPAITNDFKYILGASSNLGTPNNEKIYVWDYSNTQLSYTVDGGPPTVSPDNRNFAALGSNGYIQVWKLSNGEFQYQFKQAFDGDRIVYSPNGNYLFSVGGNPSELQVWSIKEREVILTQQVQQEGLSSLAISSDGNYLVSGCTDGTIIIWNVIY